MTPTTGAKHHPYLGGNFAPVGTERDDPVLPVTGTIPGELDGLLLRNGPNPIVDADPTRYHWFDGDGMLHGIALHAGRAHYRNRWVRTPAACEALGEPAPPGPGEPNGVQSRANTHIVAHCGRIYALVETSLPTEVRSDLSTVGAVEFGGRLSTPFTAHPKSDPATGELVCFGYDLIAPPYLRYHVLDRDGALIRSEAIDIPRPVMMHNFCVTATQVVWLDLPVVFDISLFGRQPIPFVWRPEHGARLGVMPRHGGNADVRWIEIEPCFAFHELNAFDAPDGGVVVDVVRYPDMFAAEVYGPGSSSSPRLERWTLDPSALRCSTETLDERSQEWPRIDDRRAGRPYRYGYTTEAEIGRSWTNFGSLRKHDVVTGRTERHDVGPSRAASEPVFVPATPNSAEDDGWVLSVVYDAARDASDVIVVDASDFAATPLATIHLPSRVPFGFHGSWIPGASLHPVATKELR